MFLTRFFYNRVVSRRYGYRLQSLVNLENLCHSDCISRQNDSFVTVFIPYGRHLYKRMTHVECAALLFDLDGVLINSTPAVARVWRRWAIEHGFNPDEVVAHAHGRPSLTTVREYLPNADHEAENREVERREIEDIDGVVPLPGALELLGSLPPDRWTIVTSCTRPLAEVRIKAAGLPLPKKMITSNDIVHGKPNPEPYLKGASILGFAAEDCVVFEDVPAGVRAGKGATAKVVAFTTTVQGPSLREAGADWILRSCSDVRLCEYGKDLSLALMPTE
jgi:sugar-phosphatase